MTQTGHSIPSDIRELLACPKCRGPLLDVVSDKKGAQPKAEALLCGACGLTYPIEEGIPVLLIERATPSTTAV